ncbi:TRAP transporter TatT component family protein [Pseudobacteriovorax antillogorgiicola]|uniref:TRAP transporter T-component n=1 Tax=Pseudobacteriovorax antillogorgiicola TaxID=1513793 RepID=A0A1Y6CFW7_9BACT|nr:TRAP transporter TatT component family protein [Pseudobacteriovorax antillogorgiicola]TCS47668.1 TRAP transporter TatT component family protein [Pseudobacteriovorax antillogorgiicola]SMF59648.1 TRAP transporter T-component [Pseudobacteriovorax antillogorgiicola]
MLRLVLLCFVFASLLSGCSIQRLAIGQLAPALSSASPKLQEEKNWDLFKTATPGSLQLAEILLVSDPGNEDLLALLTKGYAAYGYVVNDTEYLHERLADVDEVQHKSRALFNLAKGLEYGFAYLEEQGVSYLAMLEEGKKGRSLDYLNSKLDKGDGLDLETTFFTGTAWLLLANLRKDNMILVSQISSAFQLIEWVCTNKPNYQNGLCSAMTGVFHLARPKTLGGKPELAVKLMQEAMKKHPDNLLIPVVYMEWYLIPFEKQDEFQAIKRKLAPKFKDRAKQHFIPGETLQSKSSMLNLFNAMAEKRFQAIIRNEGELF